MVKNGYTLSTGQSEAGIKLLGNIPWRIKCLGVGFHWMKKKSYWPYITAVEDAPPPVPISSILLLGLSKLLFPRSHGLFNVIYDGTDVFTYLELLLLKCGDMCSYISSVI